MRRTSAAGEVETAATLRLNSAADEAETAAADAAENATDEAETVAGDEPALLLMELRLDGHPGAAAGDGAAAGR